jgi:hypothetical protein
MKKVVISSLHSDSIRYLRKINPETVISFDAHPDLGHWNNVSIVKSILELQIREKVKSGLFRASIQALLRVCLPQARIFSVVPEACVITDFNWDLFLNGLMGGRPRRQTFTKHLAISTWKQKLATLMIEGCMIPPSPIKSLLPVAKGDPLVFDIDVDYLFELTKECQNPAGFTDAPVPIYGTPRGNLGSASDVLRVIADARPDLITLSEITFKCLESSNKNWSHFLSQLKKLDYDIENGIVYSDAESRQVLRVSGDFSEFYTHRTNCKGQADFLQAYLEFFESLGLIKETDAGDGRDMPPLL